MDPGKTVLGSQGCECLRSPSPSPPPTPFPPFPALCPRHASSSSWNGVTFAPVGSCPNPSHPSSPTSSCCMCGASPDGPSLAPTAYALRFSVHRAQGLVLRFEGPRRLCIGVFGRVSLLFRILKPLRTAASLSSPLDLQSPELAVLRVDTDLVPSIALAAVNAP